MYIKESQFDSSDELIDKQDRITRDWREVFFHANKIKTSDIHVRPMDTGGIVVKMRQSGELLVTHKFEDPELKNDYYIILKRISGLRNDTTTRAQDGEFELKCTNSRYRVRTTPVRGMGEMIVFRVIRDGDLIPITEMGFSETALEDILWALDQDYGAFLVTGPTSSGKSTTLQGAISNLDRDIYNVITIENPIERRIPEVMHTQISAEYDWVESIKGALRSDPDYLLVGEIRDRESAELCFEAAQSGHLVFSTLHLNNVAGVVNRLIGLGVERQVIADNLLFCSSQKFAPKLCPECKIKSGPFYKRNQTGCPNCHAKGVRGIVVLMEYAFRPPPESILEFNRKIFSKKYLKQSFFDDVKRYVESGQICVSYMEKSYANEEGI
jgi:type II secretory ATPase GspE/PulE/Tfp pilus assembly ATPase PilB-like protein